MSGLIVLFSACVKDEIEVTDLKYNIQPQFGVPIARAHIAGDRIIANFNEDGYIATDATGLIHVIYRDTIHEFNAGDFLDLGNQTYSDTVSLSALEYASLLGTGSVTVSGDKIFSFESAEGDKLDSIRFATGLFKLNVYSQGNFPVSGNVKIYAPDNSVLMQLDFSDATAPIQIENEIDFANQLLLFYNDNQQTNGLRISHTLTFSNEGGGSNEPAYLDFGITDFSIKSAGGYIAPRVLSLDDEGVGIRLFDDFPQGVIRIEDPRLQFNISNGFGIGMGIEVYSLYGINASGQVNTIDGTNINQLPVIAPAPSVGQTATSVLAITNEFINPSLTDFFAFMPQYAGGSFGLAINPGNQPSTWVSNESAVNLSFEADIPVYGSVTDFLLLDTTALSLGDLVSDANDFTEISRLDVRMIVDNGLPLDAGVQIIFADSLLNPLDSLRSESNLIFSSAPVNRAVPPTDPNYGRATGSTRTISDFTITNPRIRNLEHASRMIIRVYGNTEGNHSDAIRLFQTDFFDVQLSAKATLNLNSDD